MDGGEAGERPARRRRASAAWSATCRRRRGAPGDRGEYIARFDEEFRERWRALVDWQEKPEAESLIPTADEWAAQVDYVIRTVGADHVGDRSRHGRRAHIGAARRRRAIGDIVAALNRITTPENVRKITGENWLRVLEKAKAA